MLAGFRTDCKLVDAELDRRFASGAPVLSLQVQRHLGECERCRKLYDYISALQDIGHLLVWHGGVLFISTLVGCLIGRSVSRLSAHLAGSHPHSF